jgi:hypothetical protein
VGVPSALQCYAWPDGSVTQTFDPQSPPCIADWPEQRKGNGGATAPGVTATEVRVAVPEASSAQYNALPTSQPMIDFINTHFQLYGRKIRMVPFHSQQMEATLAGDWGNPSAQHADAVQASGLRVFAATDFVGTITNTIDLPEYVDVLAQHHVIALSGGQNTPFLSDGFLAKRAPYAWSYTHTLQTLFENAGALACRSLAGKHAVHSLAYQTKPRTFGVVVPDLAFTGDSVMPFVNRMKEVLAGCGAKVAQIIEDTKVNRGANLNTALTKAKANGITTLFWMDWVVDAEGNDPQHVADRLQYAPEWIGMNWNPDYQLSPNVYATTQSPRTFGVGGFDKYLPLEQAPWFRSYVAGGGERTKILKPVQMLYRELLLLASGIQMAGPRLTADTFARALHDTSFPNPGAGLAPSYQAHVGFAGDQVMADDLLGWWLDPSGTKTAYVAAANTGDYSSFYCYLELGVRRTAKTWPAADRFLQGPCR